jgi:hypothetical protein
LFILSKDLWNTGTGPQETRSSLVGYSITGGICTTNRYSIIEFSGFQAMGVSFFS